MKICMLTSGHDVFDNRIYYKEILSLKKLYKDIYLIAPGYKDFITNDGIVVKCFPPRKNWRDRIRPMKDMFNIAKSLQADVYHAHEPDSFQVATKLKKNLNCKIIYDSHEYHPEAFAEHFGFIKSPMKKLIYLYEKSLGKKADYIITVNKLLVNKFKKYNLNVELIPNYPVLKDKEFMKEKVDKPTFIYVGGLRQDRGILKILEAIQLVEKQKCKYIFVGPFETKEFESRCCKFKEKYLKSEDIVFTGKISHVEVFDYLKKANAGFVILQPDNWRYVNAEPIKLFEYMSSKTAIIGSDFPMVRNIVEESESGLLVEPTSPKDIAKAIERISNNLENTKIMGEKGYLKVKEQYNWLVCQKRLLNIYIKLIKQL
ncbi:glycosyltransferase family 4 protein [Clostridium sp. Marseille-Q2269]|uniref:glycosyltransferase family 4 protein n=1 Tax=Clostridium sp. Marseille-Q2269 TaxID=2942205 RepID=UPI002073E109|nr:glycosyltransferase family 4 protein [Clostridium sp. Marseille-Q2269]